MNKERRKLLQSAVEHFEKAKEIITQVKEGEEEAHDNMPDGLKDGEKGEQMQNYISDLEEMETSIDEHLEKIQEITGM
jgi:flagellar biosynthesis chaperone FliJ